MDNMPIKLLLLVISIRKLIIISMTNESLKHSAARLSKKIEIDWIPTDEVQIDQLANYDAIWCSSGSPYKSMSGAIESIQFAREKDWPFFAT